MFWCIRILRFSFLVKFPAEKMPVETNIFAEVVTLHLRARYLGPDVHVTFIKLRHQWVCMLLAQWFTTKISWKSKEIRWEMQQIFEFIRSPFDADETRLSSDTQFFLPVVLWTLDTVLW